MEKIYLQKYKYVSEIVNFKEKFNNYTEALGELPCSNHTSAIKTLTNIDHEEFKELKRKTNPHKLYTTKAKQTNNVKRVKGFRAGYKLYDIMENTSLMTLLYLKKISPIEKRNLKRQLKYPGEVGVDFPKDFVSDESETILIPFHDYLLTIRIYIACNHKTKVLNVTGPLIPHVGQEILISNKNTLADLKDRIACHEDFQDMSPDVSENPLGVTKARTGDVYKSGLFYIGNTFYIDTRVDGNIDYSEVIKKWSETKNLKFGETKTMDVKIEDIVARLGYPYAYMHQGNCEHLIVITDARLLNLTDCRVETAYPMLSSFKAVKGKSCQLCSRDVAKYIVRESKHLIYDYGYLCSTCMLLYHYNGLEKMGNFKLYKYVDRVGIF